MKQIAFLLAVGLSGALAAGCSQQPQTAQAIYAPPASSPDGVLSGATTPGFAGHEAQPTRSGINSNPGNPSGMPGPSISHG